MKNFALRLKYDCGYESVQKLLLENINAYKNESNLFIIS